MKAASSFRMLCYKLFGNACVVPSRVVVRRQTPCLSLMYIFVCVYQYEKKVQGEMLIFHISSEVKPDFYMASSFAG